MKDRSKGSSRKKIKRALHRYLIVSEDAKSSIDYFSSFLENNNIVEIVTVGGAGNTRSVVEKGIELQREARKKKQHYAHVYCVFDRDDHPVDRYRAAFDKAKAHNDVSAIWANECYELWLMLHFKFHHTGIGRQDIYKYLDSKFPGGYEKGSANAYSITRDKIEIAINRANKIRHHAKDANFDAPWMVNPSTNIQELAQKLIELSYL